MLHAGRSAGIGACVSKALALGRILALALALAVAEAQGQARTQSLAEAIPVAQALAPPSGRTTAGAAPASPAARDLHQPYCQPLPSRNVDRAFNL
jgi:hypothetical protein